MWSACILIKPEFSNIFEKYYVKCHEIPSRGSRVVLSGRTDGRIDMTKLKVALSNSAKASHKYRGTHILKLAPDCSFLSNVTQLMDG